MFDTLTLQALRLPKDSPVRRARLTPPAQRAPGSDEAFDFRTLAYGAVWVPERRAVILVCPPLRELEPVLRHARIAGTAGALSVGRLVRYRRWDALWCRAAGDPGPELDVTLPAEAGGARLRMPVMPRIGVFDRLRCLVTKSKDNELDWIADWAAHHVRAQGTEAIILFDNGSTRYAPAVVTESLAAVPGLKAALVVSADLPFGPTAKTVPKNRELFFQSATLNLARLWLLRRAAAVAVNDVDELFVSRGARTIYEAAAQSWLGYVTAPGIWRHAATGQAPRHVDHQWAFVPEKPCTEKYCVRPGGPLGGLAWDVHGVGRYQFNRVAQARDQRFLHCRAISTGWKYDRSRRDRPVEHCPETRSILMQTLGEGA
ncbi:hypothetical protein [Rhodosalinus halophilus]|uniref:hypothetical protein n=1 Tax=Rhodosalinus halophilus TaxID=2259333 RepID=UPI000DDE46F6|nr:hypothetical protein [Rhodosalinus halophilus]